MLNEYSPTLPFSRQLRGQLNVGFHVHINGFIPPNAQSLCVNLKCGVGQPGYPEPNIALHLNPRFNEKAVVRNTYISSGGHPIGWGSEERSGGFPFKTNSAFDINIYATDHAFTISINGSSFAEYKYRLPLNTIRVLTIDGQLTIYQVSASSPGAPRQPSKVPDETPLMTFTKAVVPKVRAATIWGAAVPKVCVENAWRIVTTPQAVGHSAPPPYTPYPTSGLPIFVSSPSIPTTIHIPGNMQPGMTFSFSGSARPGGKCFAINWNTVNGDVAFHFNPRLAEMIVVRNTQQHQAWGPEERAAPYFPFHGGVVFHLLVRCHPTHYEVSVNGQLFINYNHRIHPINMVQTISVLEDVCMHSINITQ